MGLLNVTTLELDEFLQNGRLEDIAYCPLVMFNIHMPLIHTEDAQAFVRLQQEIFRTSEDLSIPLWAKNAFPRSGGLLSHTDAFKNPNIIHIDG
ncbi:het domain protein [Colletotrichum truncatum]|uniref:Het domain protein n=1 Tax=Colletotrichum truncatum TaxID=5467 RepID=A0ACC3YUG5_COLTU